MGNVLASVILFLASSFDQREHMMLGEDCCREGVEACVGSFFGKVSLRGGFWGLRFVLCEKSF